MKSAAKSNPSPFIWLVIPILIIVAQTMVELFAPREYMVPLHTEGGPIETIQFIVIVLAVFLAGYLFLKTEDKFLKIWCAILLLGSFYIAGEEVSWGQQLFFWSTPDFWTRVNDQGETNLHNTSSWLDQKPRALLFIGMLVGGLIIPALRKWAPDKLPTKFAAIYPKDYIVPTALGVVVPYVAQEISHLSIGHNLFWRVSEVQELYMYYFILLYLIGLKSQGKP